MAKKEFTNPINSEKVELDECKLSKSIEDYEGRAERIPNIDKNYVDLGIQFRLSQLINSKNVSFPLLAEPHNPKIEHLKSVISFISAYFFVF